MARGPGFVRIGAAVAGCALVAACTPDPAPPATPTPTTSSAAVTPTPSASSTETDIERQQRLDFEAAEGAYRASALEQERQARLGLAESTPELLKTAEGEYLDVALSGLRDLKKSGWRIRGTARMNVVRLGWAPQRLHLLSCEDASGIRIVDKSGKDVTPTDRPDKFVQDLTVKRVGQTWKISGLDTKKTGSFEGASCAGQ